MHDEVVKSNDSTRTSSRSIWQKEFAAQKMLINIHEISPSPPLGNYSKTRIITFFSIKHIKHQGLNK